MVACEINCLKKSSSYVLCALEKLTHSLRDSCSRLSMAWMCECSSITTLTVNDLRVRSSMACLKDDVIVGSLISTGAAVP